jgi:hypothetical protein
VRVTTSDGTATSPDDYLPTDVTAAFPTDVTTATISIPLTNDSLGEADETLQLRLSQPGEGALIDQESVATLVIVDNDRAGSSDPTQGFTVNDVTAPEGDSGQQPFTFVLSRTGATSGASTVPFYVVGGTATQGSDFRALSGLLSFRPGETSKLITVQVIPDTVAEPHETFIVALGRPTAGTATKDGVGTIVNDD